ncbi:hypothetical protein NP233_g4212 [Leucocoprinus birnbaumii]|uniref:L-lactate dehydrogenase (cytochrome) n=1 Tax=Leucocoprinus birnbaumii TaxID=56174 RepID=A0AAD5VYU3_9AGAR|nr:hypothetical protein NP233_g4212 [Leucocoprinus birnbaumii]
MSSWTLDQVAQHDSALYVLSHLKLNLDLIRTRAESSCWVIIQNFVYDVTEFLHEHPGGADVILKYAGHDATAVYVPIHPPDALTKNLPSAKHLGPLNSEAVKALSSNSKGRQKTKDELRVEEAARRKPPLDRILNLRDMEAVAFQILSSKANAYYSSASDDEISLTENARSFSRFFFHPRVMRPVARCDPSTRILGFKSSIPVFASGAALAKLGHPEGEANITRGAAQTGIIQMVSFNSSLSYSEIMSAATSSQALFFQLYKQTDSISEQRIREIEALGYKAIFLTVDAIVIGNREKAVRNAWELEDEEKGVAPYWYDNDASKKSSGVVAAAGVRSITSDKDLDLSWEKTIPWLRSITKLPVVIKGIQCIEDAVIAVEAGVDGILLSNHGGRQLDYSLPPIEVLYRLRLRRPDVFEKVEVYIDGGIRRGTDVVKALCLGATAVGLGRSFLYAQSAYGEAGVVRIVKILRREILTAMRLLGASTVADLRPDMVVSFTPKVSIMSAIRALRQLATPLVARRTLCTATAAPRVASLASRNVAARGFASSMTRFGQGSTDVALSQKLQEELSYEKETGGASDDAPQFVKDFEGQGVWSISDVAGHDEVTISRKFGNENIRVIFSIGDIGPAEDEFVGEEGEEEEADQAVYPVRTSMTITKTDGPGALCIDTIVQEGQFLVDNISYYEDAKVGTELSAEADWKRRGLYIGPQFETLDVSLQDEFDAFLKERGINETLAHFIPQFAEYKEQKEYVKWLGKVKSFIDA